MLERIFLYTGYYCFIFPIISKLISRVSSLFKSEIFTVCAAAAKEQQKHRTGSIDSLHAGKTLVLKFD